MTATPGEHHVLRTSDGVGLDVQVHGDGPAIVLLHGFPDSQATWDGVVPHLVAAGHRVVRFDGRGFGRSDAPRGRRHYRFDRLVQDVVEVLEQLDVRGPVTLVGHDWGALVSWGVAIAHPEVVARHVAISVGHPAAYRSAGLEQKRKGLYVVGFQAVGLAERLIMRRDFALFRGWARSHPDPDRVAADMGRPGRLTAGLNWYRRNVLTIFARRWGRTTVPTMGIFPARDAFLVEAQMRDSVRWVDAEWEHVRIEGAGHWVPEERPEQIAGLVARWARPARPADA